jgi:mannose-6-phosphate isomerase
MRPVPLPANPVERFYRGGARIAELRGEKVRGERVPEDWVGSTTTVHGSEELGLSLVDDGTLLGDLIPTGIPLLVKLLDAGERLPVHVHPNGDFARRRLDASCGKTEAWFVICADGPEAFVWLGLREAVDDARLSEWVEGQHIEALLGALNRVPVQAGDALFVPAGQLHAIGEGVLICELQEPSDLSLLLEWRGRDLDGADPYLGLGLAGALDATVREPLSPAQLDHLKEGRGPAGRPGAERLLPAEADEFFRLERIEGSSTLPQELSVLVVLDGEGRLLSTGHELALQRGATVLVPWDAGHAELEGDLDVLRCMPRA